MSTEYEAALNNLNIPALPISSSSQDGAEKPTFYESQHLLREMSEYKKRINEKGETVVYKGEDLSSWRGFCPSKLKVEDGISQTRVYLQPENHDREIRREEDLSKIVEEIEKDFNKKIEKFKSNRNNGQDVVNVIRELAESFNVKTGKWLLAIPWRFDVDTVWQKIVESFLRKEAPDGVRYIRVYARDESIHNPYRIRGDRLLKDAMLSVMVDDWTDRKAVYDVSGWLKQNGVRQTLKFKPDIYSALNINRANEYIKPTLYTIEWNDDSTVSSDEAEHSSFAEKMESHRNKGKGSRSSKNVNSQSLNEQPVVVIGTGEKSKNDVEDLSNKDDLIEEIRRLKEIVRLQELKLKVAEEDSKESFAFGFDPQQFKDEASVGQYVENELALKIKTAAASLPDAFLVTNLLCKDGEWSPMPCEAFNIFKTCEGHQDQLRNEGHDEYDDNLQHGGHKDHICSLCWNSFNIMLPHRAATCSLIRKKFWRRIGFENDLD